MDRNSQQPQQRDMVFCHECENEWYRDEHGLTCPECQSDFTEIIEAQHDPRDAHLQQPADEPTHHHGEYYGAPDPDEEDIDNLGQGQWRQTGPNQYRTSINRTINIGPGQGAQQQGQGSGLIGGLLGMVGGMLNNAQQPGQQQGQPQQTQRPQSPDVGPGGRAASAPGSPRDGSTVRHFHGPGFHMTMMTSSSSNLYPRNANAPQPYQQQPLNIEQMMNQMMMNIGAFGPQGHGMGMGGQGGPRVFMDAHPTGMGVGADGFHGAQQAFGAGPFGNLLQMFGMPGGGQMGDAVFTQEAMDRIMTQLMEQHQNGNAPGPASEQAISALPTRKIDEKDLGENGKAECTICMDEVNIGATVTVLPCSHWFHHECIKAWLSEHDTCPHCRQGIMPKDQPDTNQPRQPSQAPLHDMNSPEYTRPRDMPGGFPATFSRQSTQDGSQQHPFSVPDSPTMHRRSSSTPGLARQAGSRQGSSSGGGTFQRMRDAFSNRGSSSSGNGGGGSGWRGNGSGAPS